MTLQEFLQEAWLSYISLTTDAPRIHALLQNRGEMIVNDHIALRTFDIPGIDRRSLGGLFEAWGYSRGEDLGFPDKLLNATYYLPPDSAFPTVFISELVTEEMSPPLREWVRDLGNQAAQKFQPLSPRVLLEPGWAPVRYDQYKQFYPESEYAAWTAAFGIRVNHFTVLVNALRTFGSLEAFNKFLQENGFILNNVGGIVKGTPLDLLEQSSTFARPVQWQFADGVYEIPGCYYEFARRYPLPGTDRLFPGFVPASASRLFESTAGQRNGERST